MTKPEEEDLLAEAFSYFLRLPAKEQGFLRGVSHTVRGPGRLSPRQLSYLQDILLRAPHYPNYL